MKKVLYLSILFVVSSIISCAQYEIIPESQYQQLKTVRDSIGTITGLDTLFEDRLHSNGLPYHIYIPSNLKPGVDYPLVTFLHGWSDLKLDIHDGFPKGIWTLPNLQNKHPHILFLPRHRMNSDTWDNATYREKFFKALDDLIHEINNDSESAHIDTSRLYLTGFSLGGMGTWNYIRAYPHKFAAAAPLSGFAAGPQNADEALPIKHIPIWIFNGDGDDGVGDSRKSYYALSKAGAPDIRYHEYEGQEHVIDDFAYFTEGFMDWFFAQKISESSISKEK